MFALFFIDLFLKHNIIFIFVYFLITILLVKDEIVPDLIVSSDFKDILIGSAPLLNGGTQMNFQIPATPIAERIIEIHHHICFFLVMVLIFVIYMIYIILLNFALPFKEGMLIFNDIYNLSRV